MRCDGDPPAQAQGDLSARFGAGEVPLQGNEVSLTATPSHCLNEATWTHLGSALELSPRQLEITRCVFDGMSECAIGRLLGVSTSTIHTHLDRLYKKLRIHGRSELVVALFVAYASRRVGVDRPSTTGAGKPLPKSAIATGAHGS